MCVHFLIYSAPILGHERFIFCFWESPTTGWHAWKVNKHFHCLIICIYFLSYLHNDSQTIRSTIHFSESLLCMTLICSDWSDWWLVDFIMPVMSDKAAFVSAVMFWVQRYRGNCYFTAAKAAPWMAKNKLTFSFRPTREDQQVGGQYANVSSWPQHETAWDSF